MAAAMIAVPTLLGGAAIAVTGGDVAHALRTVQVCKRIVPNDFDWVCVEWSTCVIDDQGQWACDDGIYGGPPSPAPKTPIQN
jgi:hypothetical protein